MNERQLAAKIDNDSYGQTFYIVDSDYRTSQPAPQGQGWSQTDGTGPLDLQYQRNQGYVHYTPGGIVTPYTSDAAAFQGAVDKAVDFRGDKIYLTPGSYSIGTAVSMDCASLRVLGRRGAIRARAS